jgi:hypothetical protein
LRPGLIDRAEEDGVDDMMVARHRRLKKMCRKRKEDPGKYISEMLLEARSGFVHGKLANNEDGLCGTSAGTLSHHCITRTRSEGEKKESIIKYHRATINASGENFPVMHIYEIFRVKDNLDRLVFIVLS